MEVANERMQPRSGERAFCGQYSICKRLCKCQRRRVRKGIENRRDKIRHLADVALRAFRYDTSNSLAAGRPPGLTIHSAVTEDKAMVNLQPLYIAILEGDAPTTRELVQQALNADVD